MKKLAAILLLVLALSGLSASGAQATSPYTTWALGPGGLLFLTQDAYRPYDEIALPIAGAEDFIVTADGTIYLADTGKGRILKLENFEIAATLGAEVLQSPTGIDVGPDGTLYIADAKTNTVVILDQAGNLISQLGRPGEPLFGKSRQFLPRKIAVDARKNLYIINEGSVNGIVQMNPYGNFIGYFGANAASTSVRFILQRLFLSEEQLDQFIKNTAASPSNLAIDSQGMVYTVTSGSSRGEGIRRFIISGKNIFPTTYGSTTFRDIHVSEDGLVIAVDESGQIYEYDTHGTLLFVFGAKDQGEQRLGTLLDPTAIARFGDFLYVLDRGKNAIVIYQSTEFSRRVHQGVKLYMDGFYVEARPYFEEVLNFNGSFIMAYQAIADAYFKQRDFVNALAYYRYAEDRPGYSQAFWELRNAVLQQYLSPALFGLIGLWVIYGGVSRLDRRYRWFEPLRAWLRGLQRFHLVDDFVFMFRFIRQPADSFYYIKKNQRGSLWFALLVYLWVVALRLVSLYLTGFVFNPYPSPANIRVENELIPPILLIFLWNAANYLVSTISDGEGRVRDVIVGSAYSLFPLALFSLPLALLSNVLSLNEVFIYTFTQNILLAWTGLMLSIMVMEIHNYSFRETIRNIITTLFTMALFMLTGYILYVLFSQLFDFVFAIYQELRLRV
jgi:DNA-binding beta-propeller fold protein YncE